MVAVRPFFKVSPLFSSEEILCGSPPVFLEWHSSHFRWRASTSFLSFVRSRHICPLGNDTLSRSSPISLAPVICVIQKLSLLTVSFNASQSVHCHSWNGIEEDWKEVLNQNPLSFLESHSVNGRERTLDLGTTVLRCPYPECLILALPF